MALICRQHNLLFIMTPRTACTAIGELLRAELSAEYLPAEDVHGANGDIAVQQKHSTLEQLAEHGILSDADRQQLFVIAAVRNPFDSLVSLYVKKSEKYRPLLDDPHSWVHQVTGYADDMRFCQSHTFDQWIEKHFATSFLDRIKKRGKRKSLFRKYVDGVDAIIKFETLQEDFDQAIKQAGVATRLTIPQVNQTAERQNSYRDYYTPRSRHIVEQTFSEDLKRFSYSF